MDSVWNWFPSGFCILAVKLLNPAIAKILFAVVLELVSLLPVFLSCLLNFVSHPDSVALIT